MRKSFFSLIILLLFSSFASALTTDTLKYGIFGKIAVYKPTSAIKAVILFVSGDGGLNKGVSGMAKCMVAQGALIAAVDIRLYYKELKKRSSKCYYPAGDFEELSLMLQKKYRLSQYLKPILVGYSSGATLVYGMLAQAPANTFKGAISLGFCPDIEINKPLCSGSGLKQHTLKEGEAYFLEASNKLTAPFIILNGTKDKACPIDQAKQFIKGVNTGHLIELPKIAHGFSVTAAPDWLPQYIEAYKKILVSPSYPEQKMAQNALLKSQKLLPLAGDFPIITIPSALENSLPMVFMISGDGGWTSFDNSLGESLAAKGMPVVGIDAQKYFWNTRTPQEAATAVSSAVSHFMLQWKRKKVILVGYSFGACVLPFIADRLPAALKESLVGVYSLSPDETADFEIHISDMLNLGIAANPFKVPAGMKKIRQLHPVCIFGEEEDSKLRNRFAEAGIKIITVPGNHHYNNNPSAAAEAILKDWESMRKK